MVKLVHPDLNPGKDRNEFIRLNHAYEVLSDASTRQLYDLYLDGVPLQTEIESVTPEERYRENYRWRKVQERRAQMEAQVVYKQKFYRYLRVLNGAFFLVALILSYDYYQTSSVYHFFPKDVSTTRRGTTIQFSENSAIETGHGFYRAYTDSGSKQVKIHFSAVLGIPRWVTLTEAGRKYRVKGTIYVFRNAFSFLLFAFSLVVVGNKRYTDFRLTCGVVGAMVMFWIFIILAPFL